MNVSSTNPTWALLMVATVSSAGATNVIEPMTPDVSDHTLYLCPDSQELQSTSLDNVCLPDLFVASLGGLIDEICADPRNFEPGEIAPNAKAIADIKSILAEVETAFGKSIYNGDITPYFGELSITWRRGDDMLRLTSFSDNRVPRIDFGTTPDGALGEYQFEPIATGESLAEHLRLLYGITANLGAGGEAEG